MIAVEEALALLLEAVELDKSLRCYSISPNASYMAWCSLCKCCDKYYKRDLKVTTLNHSESALLRSESYAMLLCSTKIK